MWSNLCIHHLCKEEMAQNELQWPAVLSWHEPWCHRRGEILPNPLCAAWGDTEAEGQPSSLVSWAAGRKKGGYLNRQYFCSSFYDHRWSGLRLLQCWTCLCLSKQLWAVFCMGPLNCPGAVDILICGNSFSAVCSLTWTMFHPSSKPFSMGQRDDFLLHLGNASCCVLVGL